MRDKPGIVRFIAEQPEMMRLLQTVEKLRLPDGWIGAGFVRNAVWDYLHGRPWTASYGDLDVVYFDADHLDPLRDGRIEAALTEQMGDVPWSVTNQARMNSRNGDSPYRNTGDALAHWPETCTAIAARTIDGAVKVLAPFGVDDLISLIVRPTPGFERRIEIIQRRAREKHWRERWDRLEFRLLERE